jgi:hypothetical protein
MMPYILNVALILAGCLAFYKLLLQKETFYQLNRYVLAACLLVAFTLPLMRVPPQWSLRKTGTTNIIQPPASTVTQQQPQSTIIEVDTQPAKAAPAAFSLSQAINWLVYLYWFGVIAFALNFLVQVAILVYRTYKNPIIQDGPFRIVEVSGDKAPCSFGNNIYINPEKYDWETYNQILLHEKVHIRQKHTLDILLAEIMLIFQWFNPFAWMYRKEVEHNLEFLTDAHLVQENEVEPASYQLSLLKVSAPHFPLSLTTNYNQSLLKKRIVMMNTKKSNVHTAWKYGFLLPLLVFFACLLNEPIAYSQSNTNAKTKNKDATPNPRGMETEGAWFATISNGKISIQFKSDDQGENQSMNSSTFDLSDFPNLPRDTKGTFKLTREAGTMEFTGKFEGDNGMGRYNFTGDQQYAAHMTREGVGTMAENDLMVFFFIDIKKSYLQMLKESGFAQVRKNDLIPMAALNIDKPFISSIQNNGYKNVGMHQLIPLKSLNIDGNYIKSIREAGYTKVTLDQLITFKAQNIDKEYLLKVKKSRLKDGQAGEMKEMDPQEIITFKAMEIDDNFVNSFKEAGFTNISNQDLVSFKSLHITPEFIKSFQAMGYKQMNPSDIISLKSLNITPEFIKGFESVGYKDISLDQVVTLKSMDITPAYITSMKEKGFNFSRIDKYVQLKAIGE